MKFLILLKQIQQNSKLNDVCSILMLKKLMDKVLNFNNFS